MRRNEKVAQLVPDREALSEWVTLAREDHAAAARRIGDQSAFEALGIKFLDLSNVELSSQIFYRDRDLEIRCGLQDERDGPLRFAGSCRT
jgi:hypothetical protein